MDKTLFDFDDDIDNLSNVSERYQIQGLFLVDDKSKALPQVAQTVQATANVSKLERHEKMSSNKKNRVNGSR